MGGKGRGKKIKTGGRRKREEMGSVSSENSQGTPEPKQTDNISRMVDMTEDDVVIAANEKTANGVQTRSYSQDPALAGIWEAVVRIEANTNLLVREHKELKILCEELERSLQFTQAEVDDIKKENQNLKEKKTASLRGRLTYWKTISRPALSMEITLRRN